LENKHSESDNPEVVPLDDSIASVQQVTTGGVSFGQGNIVNVGRDVIGTLQGYSHEQVLELVNALWKEKEQPSYTGRLPYKGLEAYQEGDADLFFGREKLTEELVESLRSTSFLCLAGPSGSGKSSLARAGLIPALRSGSVIPVSEHWLYSVLLPGDQPMDSLAKSVSTLAITGEMDFQVVGERLRTKGLQDPSLLATLIDLLTQKTANGWVVLLVDQFEQVFSPSCDRDQAAAFIAQLVHAAQLENSRLKIVLTLRSDYLSRCAAYPSLRELISNGFHLVGAMSIEELARAITLPPMQVGVELQPELVQQVIVDMQNEPGALPLMQFALRDLFESQNPRKGDRIQLTQQGYLERGGVWGALRRHADASLQLLSSSEQEIANQVFKQLISIGSTGVATQRAVSRAELVSTEMDDEGLDRVLDVMVSNRLLIAEGRRQVEDTTTISEVDQVWFNLAHDRLIDSWPWLAQLVETNRQLIALTSQIEAEAEAWEEEDRETGYLYRGAKLEAAQLQEENLSLSPLGSKFIITSQQQQEIELRKSLTNRLRDSAIRGLVGGAVGFGIAFLLAYLPQVGLKQFIAQIFAALFMAASGALAGLIIAVVVQALNSRSGRISQTWKLLLSGLAGAAAFSIPLLANHILLASPTQPDQAILVMAESVLWGFTAGLGVFWAVSSSRPIWQTLGIVGLSSGLVLVVGEIIGNGFAIPDRTQPLVGTATSPEPSPWVVFILGALVPICIACALHYRRELPAN
jgi:archaellum biogenesis ATPase FlaH